MKEESMDVGKEIPPQRKWGSGPALQLPLGLGSRLSLKKRVISS